MVNDMKKLFLILKHSKIIRPRSLKSSFEIILIMMMAYAFTHYLDGDIGVVVWSFLIIAPLLSIILSYYAIFKLRIHLEAPDYLAKGKNFRVNFIASTIGKLPVPFVMCHIKPSANIVQQDNRTVQSAMTPKENLIISYQMTAKYVGLAEIKIKRLAISDYLGLVEFKYGHIPDDYMIKIGVIPEIPELTNANMMLHAVSDVIATQDDEEEESNASFSAQSMLGYVHREYVAGDNLRRINWKMSAKRQKLMVRMEESAITIKPTLILDIKPEKQEEKLKHREIMIEGALGFLMLLVKQGIACSLRFASNKQWKCLALEQENDVRNASIEIATADFINDNHRIDSSASHEKAGTYLIYSTNPDEELATQLKSLRNKGYICVVCPAGVENFALMDMDSIWELSEDFTMKSLKK
ncbi:MAG: DUF58 domain-containing protein [Oscillospiraceae bacterium]|nr:DUF58 domain-containing protein [Oscillospiraceae bacterium]